MKIENINDQFSVSDQIDVKDVQALADLGVQVIICNRPDNEASDQTQFQQIRDVANTLGITTHLIDFPSKELTKDKISLFAKVISENKPTHAYCRTGSRSKIIHQEALNMKIQKDSGSQKQHFNVVIIGAGSGGIATAASLKKRNKNMTIVLIDPSQDHYYQPGWTMVGGGVFEAKSTHRKTQSLIPDGVSWLQKSVTEFLPDENAVLINDHSKVTYDQLVVAPGLTLNWSAIEGLEETLGKNSVTSNYRYDLAPYTWELVQKMTKGKAIFTQPPMPIKCAGAPQKALYLSASQWFETGQIKNIDIEFYNAGGVLFGVDAYVPALNEYIEKYQADVKFLHTLVKVDGESKTAWFKTNGEDGEEKVIESKFDFLHVCPPQCAPQFISESQLSDANGWLDVHPDTLQHKQYKNIWGVGDVMNTSNAKTMAAVRKQAPVVAQNITNVIASMDQRVAYDGYGSCPLTVERGKIVLAEFAYGGKLTPTFPAWFNNNTKPTKLAWLIKAKLLPYVYWHAMLKGKEWLAAPK